MSTTPNSLPATPSTPSCGAPEGNLNRARHGLRSSQLTADHRVSNSSLPKQFVRVERAANSYRRALERAVVAARGEIDLQSAHFISSAVRAERACHAIHKLLRDDAKLSTADKAAMLQRTITLTEKRDAAVAKLALPGPATEADLWDSVLQPQPRPNLPDPGSDHDEHGPTMRDCPADESSQGETPTASDGGDNIRETGSCGSWGDAASEGSEQS